MSIIPLPSPYPFFTDLDGTALDAGKIYIGTAGLDPRTNPIVVYQDTANTITWAQPLRTVAGYPAYQGAPSNFYASADTYSIIVTNSKGQIIFRSLNATANALQTALTASTGAALIGAATGGTVEDAIWKKGRTTAIAGSKMAIRWLRDDATFPLEDEASIWAGPVVTDHGISATFSAGQGGINAPTAGLFVLANNNGSTGDVCAGIFDAVARVNNSVVFGANIIARGTGRSGCKLVGAEIDVVPSSTDTSLSSSCIGLAINAFNLAVPGPAIQLGGVGGGTFNNGVVLGGLSTNGAGLLLGSGSANSLVNTTVGTFTGVAITLGNGQSRGIRLSGTASAHAAIYNDGSNNVRQVLGSGAWIWRDNADITSLVSIDGGGNLDLQAGGVLRVSGTQVVRARDTGWTAMTGTPDKATSYATSTVTLAQLAGRVMSIQAALTAHGLLGA